MVGVKGLEPSTSRSQTARATNCATPRCDFGNYNVFSKIFLVIIKNRPERSPKTSLALPVFSIFTIAIMLLTNIFAHLTSKALNSRKAVL
jgi:hypothetical protein